MKASRSQKCLWSEQAAVFSLVREQFTCNPLYMPYNPTHPLHAAVCLAPSLTRTSVGDLRRDGSRLFDRRVLDLTGEEDDGAANRVKGWRAARKTWPPTRESSGGPPGGPRAGVCSCQQIIAAGEQTVWVCAFLCKTGSLKGGQKTEWRPPETQLDRDVKKKTHVWAVVLIGLLVLRRETTSCTSPLSYRGLWFTTFTLFKCQIHVLFDNLFSNSGVWAHAVFLLYQKSKFWSWTRVGSELKVF